MNLEEGSGLDRLGEDLVLLSLSTDGRIANRKRIDFGLMGSELVRLAADGRITIESNHVVVQDRTLRGDAELDAALASLGDNRRGVRPKTWVRRPRRGICHAYLNRLVVGGAVRAERVGIFAVTRWRVALLPRLPRPSARPWPRPRPRTVAAARTVTTENQPDKVGPTPDYA
ncbi:MAG: GPP34 family phosphoprotein [Streptosporangiaceae bacterium]|jgi:hypothetical protein